MVRHFELRKMYLFVDDLVDTLDNMCRQTQQTSIYWEKWRPVAEILMAKVAMGFHFAQCIVVQCIY